MKTPLIANQKFSLEDGEERVDGQMYQSLIGSMLYLTNNRHDIMYVASLMSRSCKSK